MIVLQGELQPPTALCHPLIKYITSILTRLVVLFLPILKLAVLVYPFNECLRLKRPFLHYLSCKDTESCRVSKIKCAT